MKKLGFGLMRLPLTDPEDKGSIDLEHTKRMVDRFLEQGFTYFDTAWMYCGHKSEEATGEALVSVQGKWRSNVVEASLTVYVIDVST